jgi:hypothetical protein
MNRETIKKILNTKAGTLAFNIIVIPSILIVCTIGATMLRLGSKRP